MLLWDGREPAWTGVGRIQWLRMSELIPDLPPDRSDSGRGTGSSGSSELLDDGLGFPSKPKPTAPDNTTYWLAAGAMLVVFLMLTSGGEPDVILVDRRGDVPIEEPVEAPPPDPTAELIVVESTPTPLPRPGIVPGIPEPAWTAAPTGTPVPADPPSGPVPLPRLVERVRPSIVFLYWVEAEEHGVEHRSTGTGFVFTNDGLIGTNRHVVEGAQDRHGGEVMVRFLDGRIVRGQIAAIAPDVDLAVVRAAVPSDIPPLELGDSDELHLADSIAVIGYPLGQFSEVTVTPGLIGSFRREEHLIQLSAAVNQGNSGGPVFDTTSGKVVAVVVSKAMNAEQMGFAIPMNIFQRFVRESRLR